MTREDAIRKAASLLRLAKSDNPNEAATAAAKAQEIIDRYQLESLALEYEGGEVEPQEDIKDFWDDPVETERRRVTWKIRLAAAIARSNQARMYTRGGNICLVGRPSDVATVRYLYAMLAREVERLAKRDTVGYGRTYANNYRIGVVETISNRLYEQRKQTEQQMRAEALDVPRSNALVHIEQAIAKREERSAEVQQWVKDNLELRTVSVGRSYYDPGARARGREAGKEIPIHRAKGAIESES